MVGGGRDLRQEQVMSLNELASVSSLPLPLPFPPPLPPISPLSLHICAYEGIGVWLYGVFIDQPDNHGGWYSPPIFSLRQCLFGQELFHVAQASLLISLRDSLVPASHLTISGITGTPQVS